MQRLAITRIQRGSQPHIACITLDEKRDFVDFQLFEQENKSILNNIYVGRVENIVPGISAAFVRISKNQQCFLSLKDLKNPLFVKKQSARNPISIGDMLVVQVTREAMKTKEAVAASKLTLQGRCCVLTTENTALSVSRKLKKEQREEYQQFLETLVAREEMDNPSILSADNSGDGGERGDKRDFGIILRTDAASCSREEIAADVGRLIEDYRFLKETAPHQDAFALLRQNPPAYIEWLKSCPKGNLDGIVTDQEDLYAQMKESLPYLENLFSLYEDQAVSLSTLYHLEGNIDKLLSSKVWLSSGANIIIEQLETLTFIDVNTGKNLAKGKGHFLSVNREAAVEIARQLRLRNISGMILIDFINLTPEEEPELVALLKQELKKDYCPASFVDITKLGLVELTRKKVHKSLREILSL